MEWKATSPAELALALHKAVTELQQLSAQAAVHRKKIRIRGLTNPAFSFSLADSVFQSIQLYRISLRRFFLRPRQRPPRPHLRESSALLGASNFGKPIELRCIGAYGPFCEVPGGRVFFVECWSGCI
jgi:hypothetical protein